MRKIKRLVYRETVLIIAVAGALVSMCFVPVDKRYLSYIDTKTLLSLFAFMEVIADFRNIQLFRMAASFLMRKINSRRKLVSALIFITYFFSMFIANDMALLTFLPFTLTIFRQYRDIRLCMFTIVMQNIAANLGGMLTPFGNPQNLFLYSYYNIPTADFFSIMSAPFIVSLALICVACIMVKDKPLNANIPVIEQPEKSRIILYTLLFVAVVLMVLRVIDYYQGFVFVIIVLLLSDIKVFKGVDYSLLLTFLAFFIFSGNLSRIPAVRDSLGMLIEKDVALSATLSCQLISNVPTAVLFSYLTPYELYPKLLVAVNIGGLGTLVASLASLISYKAFSNHYRKFRMEYLRMFLLINFTFLLIIYVICVVLGAV